MTAAQSKLELRLDNLRGDYFYAVCEGDPKLIERLARKIKAIKNKLQVTEEINTLEAQ